MNVQYAKMAALSTLDHNVAIWLMQLAENHPNHRSLKERTFREICYQIATKAYLSQTQDQTVTQALSDYIFNSWIKSEKHLAECLGSLASVTLKDEAFKALDMSKVSSYNDFTYRHSVMCITMLAHEMIIDMHVTPKTSN